MPEQAVIENTDRRHHEFLGFKGLNKSGTPTKIDERECVELLNYFPIIGQTLRKIPSYTDITITGITSNIVRMLPAYVGGALGTIEAILLLFHADGSVSEYVISTGVRTTIFAAATFSTPPRAVPWKQEKVLMIDPVNGYHSWDGTTALVEDATVKGRYITTHKGRVIIAKDDTNTILISAPDSVSFSATGNLVKIITDPNLKGNLTGLASTNAAIYIAGETTILALTDIFFDGLDTIAEINNLISSVGCKHPDTFIAFENIVFAWDITGVWRISASGIRRISGPIDGILKDIDFNSFSPISFVGNMYNLNFYGTLLQNVPPFEEGQSRKMIGYQSFFDEKGVESDSWFVLDQDLQFDFPTNVFEVSGTLYNFHASVQTVKNSFNEASTLKIKTIIQTKNSDFGNRQIDKLGNLISVVLDNPTGAVVFSGQIIGDVAYAFVLTFPFGQEVTWLNNSGGTIQWQNSSAQDIDTIVGQNTVEKKSYIEGRGKSLAIRLEEESAFNYELALIDIEFFNRSRGG